MRRLLFVDDEQQVLDAMRNLMRRQRKTWDMVFALSGAVALEEMKKAPFDVVVSDMRMPEMDGCALLEQVRALYPATARIVLSGHAEPETIKRALAVAHQFLSKPCDSETLRTSIERTCRVYSTLMAEPIQRIVKAFEASPTLPKSYFELKETAASPDFEVAALSAIFDRDASLGTCAMQLLNSPLLGLPARVTSVQQAVLLLGNEWVKTFAMAAPVYMAFESAPVEGFSIEHQRMASLIAARMARSCFRDPQKGQEAFVATLGSIGGRLVLALADPRAFNEIEQVVRDSGRQRHDVEREILQTTSGELAAYALSTFGLPFSAVEALAFSSEPGRVTEGPRELLAAVHVAHALTSGREPDLAFIEAAKLSDEVPRWRALADAELAQRKAAA